MNEMAKKFEGMYDPRNASYVEHKLYHILTIIMCAVLCGLDTLDGIFTFSENRKEYFKKEFGIEKTPSRATYARILSIIDGDEVGKVMVEILKEQVGTNGKVVAVDGKAVRSTSEKGKTCSALQILTAYVTESRAVLAQEAIHDKTNEIPIFQNMLKYLNIENKVVTADAMHCQRETCSAIIKKGGNYMIGLKGNQKSLYEDVKLFFENSNSKNEFEIHQTTEKNAGRIEKRICKKIKDISWLKEYHNWPGLQSVCSIERSVNCGVNESHEISFYISSIDSTSEELMRIAREHWKIESMHWMLDVVFSEDDRKFESENAHKTLNAMRKYALAVHKHFLSIRNKRSSIKSNMLACLMNSSLMHDLIHNL